MSSGQTFSLKQYNNMNINAARIIDKYAGWWACLFCAFLKKLCFWKEKSKIAPEKIKQILIIKFWGAGSVILTIPALKALKKSCPDSEITYLTFAGNKPICAAVPEVDHVEVIRDGNMLTFFLDTLSLLFIKRFSKKYDIILDFEFLARFSSLVTFILPGKVKAEFSSPFRWRGNLTDIRICYNVYQHLTKNFLNLLAEIDIHSADTSLSKLDVEKSSKISMQKILKLQNIPTNQEFILININSSGLAYERRWPQENYVELIKLIREKIQTSIILCGGREDVSYVNDFMKFSGAQDNVFSLAGKLNWQEFLALLEKCKLFISNDSGPLHIAAAQDVQTVSFFGPETPILYSPLGKKNTVFFKDRFCSPCMRIDNLKSVNCLYNQACLREITPQEVVEPIHQWLSDIDQK